MKGEREEERKNHSLEFRKSRSVSGANLWSRIKQSGTPRGQKFILPSYPWCLAQFQGHNWYLITICYLEGRRQGRKLE